MSDTSMWCPASRFTGRSNQKETQCGSCGFSAMSNVRGITHYYVLGDTVAFSSFIIWGFSASLLALHWQGRLGWKNSEPAICFCVKASGPFSTSYILEIFLFLFFLFLVILGFELRVTLVNQALPFEPLLLHFLLYFLDRVSHFLPRPASDHDLLTSTFHLSRIVGMCHHSQLVFWDRISLIFY
jgi:hypothetical protein